MLWHALEQSTADIHNVGPDTISLLQLLLEQFFVFIVHLFALFLELFQASLLILLECFEDLYAEVEELGRFYRGEEWHVAAHIHSVERTLKFLCQPLDLLEFAIGKTDSNFLDDVG